MNNADKPAYGSVAANKNEFLSAHEYDPATSGLTKREAFTMAALQGLLAFNGDCSGVAAFSAVKLADEALKELDK